MGTACAVYFLPTTGRRVFVPIAEKFNYSLPDGTFLPIEQQPAWCRACGDFVVAESLSTTQELEQRVAELPLPDTLAALAFIGTFPEVASKELRRRMEWRQSRRSGERCLQCGTLDIVRFPSAQNFEHPETGEPVIFEAQVFVDGPASRREYSPEGVQLTGHFPATPSSSDE